MNAIVLFISSLISAAIVSISSLFSGGAANITTNPVQSPNTLPSLNSDIKMLKDVGEAYMDHFGLTEHDFQIIEDSKTNVIEGNFDICADDGDVTYFLDQAEKHNLKVILNAGAGEAEWGYECDRDSYPEDQTPVWQKDLVKKWIEKWKGYPALYGWDISNEAGSVFPVASIKNDQDGAVPDKYYITSEQLKGAYKDVKDADPNHPVMIRMNGWFFYDSDTDFFRSGNPFAKDITDIVMINAYSNVDDYYEDFVPTVGNRAKSAIYKIDPKVKLIIALGVWNEPPLWKLPSLNQFETDLEGLKNLDGIKGVAFFKYGAKGSEWYLPEDAASLWEKIKSL